jgi:putative endopeptidase
MQTRYISWALALGAYLTWINAAECRAADAALKSGIDRSTFDIAVKPGDDFFQYVNGEWIKRNPIPPEYSRWGAFPKLRDDNLIALRKILDGLAEQPEPLADERRTRENRQR